jgi:rhodanese-related sulfurtransferase
MEEAEVLLQRARERAAKMKLPYAGALLPREAHQLLQALRDARLVDVRSRAEWDWVGRIPEAVMIEWNTWPSGERNPAFVDELKARVPKITAPTLFICRSGARSHNAAGAASQAGYTNAFNVLEGFEGDKNENGQRNTVGGWRAAGLPWEQS